MSDRAKGDEQGTRLALQLNLLCKSAHRAAKAKGWWDKDAELPPVASITTRLALIHSEVSEALECIRDGDWETAFEDDGKPTGLGSELADVVIRVADLCGGIGVNLGDEVVRKMTYNRTRAYRHGGKAI